VEYVLTPVSEQKVEPIEEPDAVADFDLRGTAALPEHGSYRST